MKTLANKLTKASIFMSIIAVLAIYVNQSGDFDYYIDEFTQGFNMQDDDDRVIIQYADGTEYRSIGNGNDTHSQTGENTKYPNFNSKSKIRKNIQVPNYRSNQKLNNNQSRKMTIVNCNQKADRILSGAFILPPDWQAECNTQYNLLANKLWADPLFKAWEAGSNIQLSNEISQHFYYDGMMRQRILETKSMQGVNSSVFGPEFENMLRNDTPQFMQQWDATYPQAINLVQHVNQNSHKLTKLQGYKVFHISRDPVAHTISRIMKSNKSTVNAVTIMAHTNNNPNNIKMIKIIQFIFPLERRDRYTWHLLSFVATGSRQDSDEMSKLLNLVMNTYQDNPKFSYLLEKVNVGMTKDAINTSRNISKITSDTYSEINKIYQQTFRTVQASSDRIQSNWVDGMLEVESYINPFDGKQVKLPMHNKYYYTNNLDDYLGSNNPLLNPNIDLNYLYNWRKLEKGV